MKKLINICNKLKARAITSLLLACFASFAFASSAYAQTIPNTSTKISGPSSAFRRVAEEGSAAIKSEVRMASKVLERAQEQGAIKGLKTMKKYGMGLIGDGLDFALDTVDDAVHSAADGLDNLVDNSFTNFEESLPDGFIKSYLVDYNPAYQLGKFLIKGSVDIATKSVKLASTIINKAGKFVADLVFGNTNRKCNMDRMDKIYKSGCYSCIVVKSLISSFMNACSTLYDLTREAGSKILVLGAMLWVAFYVFSQVSAMKNVEPATMVNDLLVMSFKIIGAYVVINAGIEFFIGYFISPLMSFGIDFGLMMTQITTSGTGVDVIDTSNNIAGPYLMEASDVGGVLPINILNGIINYVAAVDSVVSTHMQIGHMLTCHATNMGAWRAGLVIPNIWILLCGVAIWFCGFMMTLAVAYYLIDISFKLGFSIIALPIVVGLWPFKVTQDRLGAVVKIILKSAGIFIFLAMTTGIGLALVVNALDAPVKNEDTSQEQTISSEQNLGEEKTGAQTLFDAIETGDTDYVSDQFSPFGTSFILLLIAYLYSFKLISSTVSDYVDKFFPDNVFKGVPMHKRLQQGLDMAKSAAMKPAKAAGRIAKHQSQKGLQNIRSKFKSKDDSGGGIKSRIDSLTDGKVDNKKESNNNSSKLDSARDITNMKGSDEEKLKSNKEGGNNSGGGDGKVGQSVENSGKAIEKGGEATEAAGKAAKQGGQAVHKAGEAADKAGDGTMKAGKALSATGVGAIAGVPLVAVGAASKAAGTTAKVSGKVAEQIGKVTEETGKVMKKTGKAMKKTGKAIKKGEKNAGKLRRSAIKALGKNGGKAGIKGAPERHDNNEVLQNKNNDARHDNNEVLQNKNNDAGHDNNEILENKNSD